VAALQCVPGAVQAHWMVCPLQWSTTVPQLLAGQVSGTQHRPSRGSPVGSGEPPRKHCAPAAVQGQVSLVPSPVSKFAEGPLEQRWPSWPCVQVVQLLSASQVLVRLLQACLAAVQRQTMSASVQAFFLVTLHSVGPQATALKQHSPLVPGSRHCGRPCLLQMAAGVAGAGQAAAVAPGEVGDVGADGAGLAGGPGGPVGGAGLEGAARCDLQLVAARAAAVEVGAGAGVVQP
jgi:hypothetical protein